MTQVTTHTLTPTPTPTPTGTPTMACVRARRPLLVACVLALVPVLFTGTGFAIGTIVGGTDAASYLGAAIGTSLCALLGVLVMSRLQPSLAEFGFRPPRNTTAALWFLPMALVVALIWIGSGYAAQPGLVPVLAWVAVAAGFNEEIWYRGLILALLRPRGVRRAIIVMSSLFGVLHLANAFNQGVSVLYLALQVALAIVFGFVAAEVYEVVGSLWPVILWHAAFDASSYLTGDAITTPALLALGVELVVMLAYGVVLWRRVPR